MNSWESRLAIAALLCTSLAAAVEPARLQAARDLYDAGRLGEAHKAIDSLAATDAKDAEVIFFQGELALQRDDLEKSVSYLEKAIAAAPNVSRYHHRLGDAYGRSAQKASILKAFGFARKCLAAYQRAAEIDPANLDARYSLFSFYLQAPGIIGGGADKAATEAAAIQKLDRERGRTASTALLVHQKKFDQARAELALFQPLELSAMRSDRAFLSDVAWASAKVGWGEPTRNLAWFAEKSHQGVLLIVHGRLYAKGLYAHSPSRYTFPLDGKWNVFSATVGLREGAHQQGSAVFTVRGDGRELFRSAVLRVGASERVKVDVSGVTNLELLADPGEAHIHNSWAIWAEPMVRR